MSTLTASPRRSLCRSLCRPHGRKQSPTNLAGFTLVEVLVALFIMAILAGMAWQGIDALVRTRDGAQRNTERALQLSTVIAQWELDLAQLQQSPGTPPIRFDGGALRLSRRTPDGLQWVVWTVQGQTLYRWASPPATRLQEFQQWVQRGQQWAAMRETALPMLENVSQWQIFYFRSGDNAWSNAQSSGAGANRVAVAVKAASAASTNDDADTEEENNNEAPADQAPLGVRLVLTLPGGNMTRDLMLPGTL